MNQPRPLSEEYAASMRWAKEHYTELQKRYPDMWVALQREKVAFASANLSEVQDFLAHLNNKEDTPVLLIESEARVY